ncbi:unnamed protein product [Phytophthora fragariaefolia]|uniref:Unnamed protein product n=1 Tax=Phytophthora fragariaefolia TaxID=1490495 RepID=A0A9W6WZ25_9STRA|nr:unnamed protein product [Phytophthora fragariaefolia]
MGLITLNHHEQKNHDETRTVDEIVYAYGLAGLRVLLQTRIKAVYGVDQVCARQAAEQSVAQVKSALTCSDCAPCYSVDVDLRQNLLIAFAEMDYLGDADEKFIGYLQRCWTAYLQGEESEAMAPCTTIVQSSGFGKSRLLYQIARKTIDREELEMRVLHVCARLHRSSGFPEATVQLCSSLFGAHQTQRTLSLQLEAIYHYAQQHWSSVGYEWIELFTYPFTDAVTQQTFDITEAESKPTKVPKKISKQCREHSGRVVLLCVDEAGALLTLDYGGANYFYMLRRALMDANKRIRASYPRGGIFAVLADTSPEIMGLRLSPPVAGSTGESGPLIAYSSDPVLALGATTVWHAWTIDGESPLSEYILPHLKKLLAQEVLDVNDAGDLVPRIVLLLAMDKCVAVEKTVNNYTKGVFVGQRISVDTFLNVLGGTDPPQLSSGLTSLVVEVVKVAFEAWKSRWSGWMLGFSHFVQLVFEPSEQTFWFLLGRHAAGVLSRDQEGCYPVIPLSQCSVELARMVPAERVPNGEPDWYFQAECSTVQTGSQDGSTGITFFSLRIRSVSSWKFAIGKTTYQLMLDSVAAKLVDLASFVQNPVTLLRSSVHSDLMQAVVPQAETNTVAAHALINTPGNGSLATSGVHEHDIVSDVSVRGME